MGLHAHVVVNKCADSMPVHRLSQNIKRYGMTIHRSTLNDMFHRVAECFSALYERMVALVPQEPYVNADETTIPMQTPGKCRTAYMWTFLSKKIITYVFSTSRNGEVPKRILGNSTGSLQADAYSAYNKTCLPEGRIRSGCFAHVRRKFWIAHEGGEKAAWLPMQHILSLYELEYEAAGLDILETSAHALMRRTRGRRILIEFFSLCRSLRGQYPPQTPLGKAARYALNNWRELMAVMLDVHVRLDNNIAEGALRIIALGRKNFLFVGNVDGGSNLAILQSIVATCKLHKVNPFEYIIDVLPKLESIDPQDTHHLDQLLPWEWAKQSG
jgi:transposase